MEALCKSNRANDEGDLSFNLRPTTMRDPSSGIVGPDFLAQMIQTVRTSVSQTLLHDRFPVVIGGDCPVLLGCLAGAAQSFGRVGVFFIDGHEDAYPPNQSPTGEAADMELGFALGLAVPPVIQDAIGDLLLSPEHVCMLGPRDKHVLHTASVRSLDNGTIAYYDDVALRRSVITHLARTLTRLLASKVNRLWVHIDLDVLSTRSLPAVDYRQPGGLTWIQLEKAVKTILSSDAVIGMNLTIYNPDLDPDGRYAARIVRFLQNVL
jgi:arginase